MNKATCQNCQYFLQHYTLDDQIIRWVFCGHCRFGQVRHKLPDASACQHFVPGTAGKKRFVDKKYLSKALLQYILQMELLPDILEEYQNNDKKIEGIPKG